MSTGWLINTLLGAILLPPLNMLLLCGLGLIMRRRWPRLGMGVCVLALLLLALMSTRLGAALLAGPLETKYPALSSSYRGDAQAIVLLGGGRLANAPEYDHQDGPSSPTLRRMRYAATLQRSTGLPVLVTGGRPDGAQVSEAAIMARGLRDDFGINVKWQEDDSDNTAENARYTADMLKSEGVQHVLLVTDAMHMPRAVAIFERSGLQITPAPTAFHTATPMLPSDFIPRTGWLVQSSYALHEWIGILWYQLRYRNAV